MLRKLTKAAFHSNNSIQVIQNGVLKCSDRRCKIYNLCLNQCISFLRSNNITWEIRSRIISRALMCYLKCNMCCKTTTHIGDSFWRYRCWMQIKHESTHIRVKRWNFKL